MFQCRDREAYLYWPIVSNEFLFHSVIPQSKLNKVLHQVMVDNLKLSRQHSTCVYVTCVRLYTLIVTQYLGSGGRGHGSKQEAVTNTMSVVRERKSEWWERYVVTYLAIFAFSAVQSHRSDGVTPHMSYCSIWGAKFSHPTLVPPLYLLFSARTQIVSTPPLLPLLCSSGYHS